MVAWNAQSTTAWEVAPGRKQKENIFFVSTHFTDTACRKHAKPQLNSLYSWEWFTAALEVFRNPCSSPYKRTLKGLFKSTHKSIELVINQPWHIALCKVSELEQFTWGRYVYKINGLIRFYRFQLLWKLLHLWPAEDAAHNDVSHILVDGCCNRMSLAFPVITLSSL